MQTSLRNIHPTDQPALIAEADRAWVTPEGIGICGDCAAGRIISRVGWSTAWNVAKTFAMFGFERCDDDFCSDCDKDTH